MVRCGEMKMDEIDKAIEQLDWYFYEDDGEAAEPVTKRAYELLKGVIIDERKRIDRDSRRV
jgi:hypothetical protein